MKEIEVLLLSRDREYCKALARAFALENSKINLWIWIVHENKADLKKIMKAMKTELWQFNAIIADIGFKLYEGEAEIKNTCIPCLFLKDIHENEIPGIYRLERTGLIISAVKTLVCESKKIGNSIYGNKTALAVSEGKIKGAYVVTVIGGSGGVGATTVALAMGKQMTEEEQMKVLFLEGKEIAFGEGEFAHRVEGPNLRSFLYYLDRSNFEKLMPIDKFFGYNPDNILGFNLGNNMNPLVNLKEKETVEFINYLKKNSACDVIIFDAGGSCCKAVQVITKLSDALICIEGESNAGLKYISYLAGQDFMSSSRTVLVENRFNSRQKKMEAFFEENTEENSNIKIPEKNFQEELEGSFGDGIRTITKKLFSLKE